MSQSTSTQFTNEMQVLQQNYLKRLATGLAELRRFQEMFVAGRATTADIQQFYRLSHNFAGSGATFGFPEISRTARALHNALGAYSEAPKAGEASPQYAELTETLAAFIELSRDYLTRKPAGTNDRHTSPRIASTPQIGIFAEDAEYADALVPALEQAGFAVSITSDSAPILQSLGGAGPFGSVILVSDFSTRAKKKLFAFPALPQVPLLVIAAQDDFEMRLASLRLGACGFFTRAADSSVIAQQAARLLQRFEAPLRVLIVDADATIAECAAQTLKEAGMEALTAATPKQAMKLLSKKLDIALIDWSVPQCSARELAALIRQQQRHTHLPVIFLTTLKAATGSGTEDFLPKPFTPEQLVLLVRSKASHAI